MANILDYLDWRGDLTLDERPFNEVDNLILAELCFLDFSGIVPEAFSGRGPSLREAAEAYFALHLDTQMGLLVPDKIPTLLQKTASSRRFQNMCLDGFVSRIDTQAEVQFSALTLLLDDGTAYIAFRGTDDTIVGWKEDCNLALMSIVPAQAEAAAYLFSAAQAYPALPLRVGGHSKGGNLAVYSAVHSGETVAAQLIAVYNNDGPGFRSSLLETPEHRRIADRILTIVPESSVVGMLLEHEEEYCVVDSDNTGLFQHDGFSWQVLGDRFVHLPSMDFGGRVTEQTLRTMISDMTQPQREAFVDALFEILTCTDAQTLSELKQGGLKTASAMLKKLKELDKPERSALSGTLKLLLKAGVKSVQGELRQAERSKTRQLMQAASDWLDDFVQTHLRPAGLRPDEAPAEHPAEKITEKATEKSE